MKKSKKKSHLLPIIIGVLIIGAIFFFTNINDESGQYDNQQEQEIPLITDESLNEISDEQGVLLEEKESNTHVVEMLDFEFSPKDIVIKKGDTVTWINNGEGRHFVMTSSGKRLLDSGIVEPGESYSHTFEDVGRHKYFSPIYTSVTGTVTVEE